MQDLNTSKLDVAQGHKIWEWAILMENKKHYVSTMYGQQVKPSCTQAIKHVKDTVNIENVPPQGIYVSAWKASEK